MLSFNFSTVPNIREMTTEYIQAKPVVSGVSVEVGRREQDQGRDSYLVVLLRRGLIEVDPYLR